MNPSKYQGLSPNPLGLDLVPPVRTSILFQETVRQSFNSTRPPVSSESGFQAHQKTLR